MAGGFDKVSGLAETEHWHIVVDTLVLTLGNDISFVPYPDVAAVADILAEARPGWQVRPIGLLGIAGERLKRFPVLNS
jgi:hypothetical protein